MAIAESAQHKEFSMKMQFKRLAISAAAVGALASGIVAVSAAPAMAAPCGLSYTIGDVPGGPLKIVYYTIRNCHSYSVDRKMDYAGTTDGDCHTIPGGRQISHTRIIAGWAGVRGMKAC